MKPIATNSPPKNELIRLWYVDDQGFLRNVEALFDETAGAEDDHSIYDENDNLIGEAVYWSSIKEEKLIHEKLVKSFFHEN